VAGDVWNLKIIGRGFHDQAQTGAGIDERRHGAEAFFLLGEIMDGIRARADGRHTEYGAKGGSHFRGNEALAVAIGLHAPSFPIS
jgi:hypothetical protein